MRRNGEKKRSNFAVVEIVGTILMLGLATSSFTVIYYQVKTAPTPIPSPIVEISGTIDNNQVLLMHRGGEPLDLDTEIVLNIGGNSRIYTVGDLLDSKSKEDGYWDLSETLVYPLEYDFDYGEYPNIDINIIDGVSNSLLMTGLTRVNPECDISIEISADNLNPKELETVEFTITVTNEGNINASGISINYLLPEGLTFSASTMDKGVYDSNLGIWDIGQLLSGESIKLTVEAIVEKFVYNSPTQFAIILDGSESIEPANWTLMKKGISEAIKDDNIIPHNGCIELTIIQFGGMKPAFARLEIGPVIITEKNLNFILNKIQKIDQIGLKTPTACGILMAADVLKASDWFSPNTRQIFLLVTDGNPTHCAYPDGDYFDDSCDSVKGPKVSAENAVDYLVHLLELDEYHDEFDALSIEVTGDGHTYFLRDDIVWPQPGFETIDFSECYISNRGWVRNVKSWEDFAYSIDESFRIIFKDILVNVNIESTSFTDPKEANDLSYVILEPTPMVAVASAIEN